MKKLSGIMILTAGILWGSLGLFVRYLTARDLVAFDIVYIRATVTTVLLFVGMMLFDRKLLVINLKDLWIFGGTGICSIIFFNYCYFKTITMMSLSVAAVFLYTAPAFVILMSAVFFHEKVTLQKCVAVIMTFCGCVFVTGVWNSADTLSFAGILIGLGSGLGYALYSIFSRVAIEKGYNAITISFYTFFIAAIGCLPFANIPNIARAASEDSFVIVVSLLLGAVSCGAFFTYTTGLKQIENGIASIIASIEPVVATIIGVIIYHERLKTYEMTGIVLVLLSIVICSIKLKKEAVR